MTRVKYIGLIIVSILLIVLLIPNSSASLISINKKYTMGNYEYSIGFYKDFPAIEIATKNGDIIKFIYFIKGIGETFNIMDLELSTEKSIVNSTNLINSIVHWKSGDADCKDCVYNKVDSAISMIWRSLSDEERASTYLSFQDVDWNVEGPEELYDEDGNLAAVKFIFLPTAVDNSAFNFIIGRLKIEFTIFILDSKIKVFDSYYLVSSGDVKLNLYIDGWKWDVAQRILKEVNDIYTNLDLSLGLTLFTEALGPAESPSPSLEMRYSIVTDGYTAHIDIMSEEEIPLEKDRLSYMKIENINEIGKTIYIRFIESAYRINHLISEQPVIVRVFNQLYKSEIYISFPYFENSTLIYDPIISFYPPSPVISVDESPARTASYNELSVKKQVALIELESEEFYIPAISTDILLGILLAITLVIVGIAIGKKGIDI